MSLLPQPPGPGRSAATGSAVPAPSPNLPAELAGLEPRIEDYLDHACAPLVGRVPYEERQALRAEWRAHLLLLVEAYEELGEEHPAAVEHAIRQFGRPKDIGTEWAEEHEKGGPPPSPWPAVRAALGLFGLLTVPLLIYFGGLRAGRLGNDEGVVVGVLLTLVAPFFAGSMMGFLVRARHVLGTFLAISAFALVTLGIHLFLRDETEIIAVTGAVQALLWLPFACIGAAVGGSLQRVIERRVMRALTR